MPRPLSAFVDVYLKGALLALLVAAPASAQDGAPIVEVPGEDTPVGVAPTDAPVEAPPETAPNDAETEAPAVEAEPEIDEVPARRGSGIDGVVVDAATGETMIEAPVIVVGGSRVFTDYDGNYTLDLPPGTYTVRSYYDYYQPVRIEDVVVRRGERTELRIELIPESGMEAEEVVIEVRAETGSAASEMRARRESLVIQDGVSAEEIRRSPDSDAGEAARRIVGATILNGEYLFIRGLGGRYTSVLLNGSYLPSSDPDQPGVQLDLFPSAILNSLTIAKTFTPNLPGDAAAGTMMITTRDYPAHFTLGVSLTLGLNSEGSFGTVPMGAGGATDFLGFDDGGRALPGAARDRLLVAAPPNYTDADVLADARSLSNRWGLREGLVGPNGGIALNMGDTVMLGDRRFGYYLSLSYGNRSQVLRSETIGGSVNVEDPETGMVIGTRPLPPTIRTNTFTNTVQWGGLGSFELELSDHDEVQLTLLWSQNADSYTGSGTYYDSETDRNFSASRLQWLERTIYFGQLRGEHRGLPFGITANWSLSGSYSQRNEPDTRDLVRSSDVNGGALIWAQVPGSGRRLFLSLGSAEIDGNLDVTIPIETASIRFGGALRANERHFSLRRFSYRRAERPENPDFELLPPEDLFSAANVGPNVSLSDETSGNDGYIASQSLAAAYLMLDWPIWDWVRLVGGARAEAFRQTVNPGLPFGENSNDARTIIRNDFDVLGSAGLIFSVAPDMFVRLTYGTTVARPQIRELAPYPYPDFIRDRTINGNSSLRRTRIDNADVRWEYFLSPDEVIAVSGFFKNFEDPIELATFGNRNFSYRNVVGAINIGAEAEARFSLGRITDALRFFDIGANFTLVYSEARLSEADSESATSLRRPLAGQSPFVVNVSLGFTLPDAGLTLRVFYNVFGERLLEAGAQGQPDIYQQPFNSLDVSGTLELPANLSLRLAIENILYDDLVLTQRDTIVQQNNSGLTGSLTLSWRPE